MKELLSFEQCENGYSCISLNDKSYKGKIEIPEEYMGEPVVYIGEGAFENCTAIEKIALPSGIRGIGWRAFKGCESLKCIKLPQRVEHIGERMLYGCSQLKNIDIPDSVTWIEMDAFTGCTRLQYNEYDNGIYLGNENNPYYAFIRARDKGIFSCVVNEKTRLIADMAFNGCGDLEKVIIPKSVTHIGYYAFYDCKKLTLYCQADKKPQGWSGDWNYENCPVVWGWES